MALAFVTVVMPNMDAASDNSKAISFRIREPWGTEYKLNGPQSITYQNETTTGTLSSLFKLNLL